MNNGYYYSVIGLFDKQITNGTGNKDEVYIFDKNDSKGNYINLRKLGITYSTLVLKAKTVYGESSVPYITQVGDLKLTYEMFGIATILIKNPKIKAYGEHSDSAKKFASKKPNERNGTNMSLAIAGIINAMIGGKDYSNGATNWDGMEQAGFPADFKGASNGINEAHRNTWGWEISQEHYDQWRHFIVNVAKKNFVDVGRIHPATVGINKGKIRAKSVAVHNGTIFWKVT